MSARSRSSRSAGGEGGTRRTALMLGAVAAAYFGVLAAKWANVPVPVPADFLPVLFFLGGSAAMGLLFLVFRVRPDVRLLLPALFLYGVGVAVQYRFRMHTGATAAGDAVSQYAGLMGMGGCALAAILFRGDAGRAFLRMLAPVGYLAALAVLAGMAVAGHRFRGGMFLAGGINPTEITKVLLVLAWAPFLAARRKDLSVSAGGLPMPPPRVAIPLLLLWLLPMLALAYLRDFGMLVLCSGVLGAMLYIATARTGYLVAGLTLTAGVAAAGFFLTPHIATRISVWADPFRDPTGMGWQTLQALSALYTGGAWGIGLGAGSPRLIPVASTDFVYAVIGEELGYLGCLIVVAAFLALFRAAFDIANRQRDDAARLIAGGLATVLALQTLLNIGGVTKAIPVTGVPLPFVSHGGSSLITSFLALGILLALGASGSAGPSGGKAAKPRSRPPKSKG